MRLSRNAFDGFDAGLKAIVNRHKNCSAEASAEQNVRPLGAPGLAAVPLGDRQRRSDDADGSGYVFPVGPPLLVAVVRRMCRALCT